MRKVRVASGFATLVVMLAGQPLLAQGMTSAPLIKPGNETLSRDLGGIVNRFGTKPKLNGQTHNGTDIDLERNGIKNRAYAACMTGRGYTVQ